MIFSSRLYIAIELKDYSRSLDLLRKMEMINSFSDSQKWVYLQTYRWILDQMGIEHSIQVNKVNPEEIQWDLIPISLHSFLKREIDSKNDQEPTEKDYIHESYNDIWATYNGC
jgi:hypothetical protein